MEAPNSMGVKSGQNYPQDSITWSEVLRLWHAPESPGRLIRTQKQLHLEFPAHWSGVSPRICISTKFLGDAVAAGPGTAL